MSPSFRLFRITTISALMLLALTVISAFLLDFSLGFTGTAAAFALLFAAQSINPYMCLKLQERIKMPSLSAHDGFSFKLIATGILNLIYGLFIIHALLYYSLFSKGGFPGIFFNSDDLGITSLLFTSTVLLLAISGLTVALNSVLSFFFLRKWKKLEKAEEELVNSINENAE